ncbi:MAG: ATP-dependent helicase, partial [Methylococcaceae bacterium]
MKLSSKQRQAVECEENCLVLACPGSGKTRVLVNKAEHILNVDPGARILITSFTQDSAAEIRKRIIESIGAEKAKRVATGTFHSIAYDQLKRHGFKGTIIGTGQMRQYVARAISECNLKDFELDEAAALIESLKLDPDYEPLNDDHGRLFIAYSELTERNNVMDFSDMLSRAVRLMRNGEIKPKNCNYLFTDESQDLDLMQYAWCTEHIKAKSIFTVVGDDDQSIYKFRRALGYEGMMRFQKDFGAKIITLDTNYRCYSEILDAAAKVIVNNSKRVEKNLNAERGKGGKTEIWHCHKTDIEARFVTHKIKELSLSKGSTLPYGEWAVLARNNHNLKKLTLALDAAGIDYTFAKGSLWAKPPICFVTGLLSSLLTGEKVGFDSALHFSGMGEEVLIKLHQEYGDDFSKIFMLDEFDKEKYGRATADNLLEFAKVVKRWTSALAKEKEVSTANVIRDVFDWFINNTNTSKEDNGDKSQDSKPQMSIELMEVAKECLARMSGDF